MDFQDQHQDETTITIGQMVAEDYRKASVLSRFGLDFCCGGKKTLADACREKGIDISILQEALQAATREIADHGPDFNDMEADVLIDHIIKTHHAYVNESLPILYQWGSKVAKVHGEANPEVVGIFQIIEDVANELRMHMHKEEAILFPYIVALAQAERDEDELPPPPFGTVKNPIQMMEMEHDSAGSAFASIRRLSNKFTPPDHACNTYRALYAKLEEFEADLHQHIHLENNILFPKAVALEQGSRMD